MRYVHQTFPYRRPPELDGAPPRRRPVVVAGAGPVGLALAVDLALHGVPVVVLDDGDRVSTGSRAICWSKRTLEILDRLGVGRRMIEKGVTWKVGRLFHRDREVYAFDLLPEPGHRMPAFVNLQQYYVEEYLVARAADFPDLVEIRWRNRVTSVEPREDGVAVTVETPEGAYRIEADWLVACDGVRSTVRASLGLDFAGEAFEERFLIADVEMQAPFPPERWFWFEPPFHAGRSALLHKQPDDIWRIDLQLGPDADPEFEKRPEQVIPRIRAMIGERPFTLEWVSVYAFQCRRLARFVHGRVVFAGDAAHIVSPFGARGGNSGIQDAENLAWKLARVVRGEAGPALLESYDEERTRAADENLRHSARSTHFITPKSAAEAAFGTAVLELAADHPFARRFVNSGRLSQPASLAGLSLQTMSDVAAGVAPGLVCPDAPVRLEDGTDGFLLDRLGGDFAWLVVGDVALPPLAGRVVRVDTGGGAAAPGRLGDPTGLVRARYGDGLLYLVRPDQHVAARFDRPTAAATAAALARAGGAAAGAGAPAADAAPAGAVDLGADRLGGRNDDVYAALLAAHAGLDPGESTALDARLILLLLNLVGDADTAIAAIERARRR